MSALSQITTIVRNALDSISAQHSTRRRRHSATSTTTTAAEVLEARQLLAATNTLPVPGIAVASSGDPATLNLSDYFDDPAIEGSTVRIDSSLGSFIVETFDTVTPLTASNFLTLAEGGNYADMFVHRSDPTDPLSIIQAGGFRYPLGAEEPSAVPNNGTVVNEFDNWFDPNLGGLPAGTPLNVRGTLAMAKIGGQPDSATSQWFVNISDNSAILDPQNGGFTVFAKVLYDGMDTVEAIAALQIVNATGVFAELPVQGELGLSVQRENLVLTETTVVPELTYQITDNSNPELATASIVDGALQIVTTQGNTGTAQITMTITDLEGNVLTEVVEVAVEVPVSTSLQTPSGGGQTSRPEFVWQESSGATHYELWVNKVGGQNAIIRETALTGTSFLPTEDLPTGEYNAWIRAYSASGSAIWSQIQRFSIDLAEVQIVSPAAGPTADNTPTIQWTASDGATEYDVWINQVGVTNQLVRQTVTDNSFTPDTPFAEGTYRVWVQATDGSSTSPWSDGLTFQVISSGQIVAPAGIQTSARPEIRWVGNENATWELWVNAIGGASRVIHQTHVSGLSFTPAEDIPDGNYRAWVRRNEPEQTPGGWSDAFEFTVSAAGTAGKPEIVDVSGGTQRPTFTWNAVTNGERFELWVNQVGGEARVIHETQLTGESFASTVDLSVGSYRVWLRAFTSAGSPGEWSDAVDFSIV